MPIYEYRCNVCGNEVEVLTQSASETVPPLKCSCGREGCMNRKFSTFAAHGGGSGHELEHDCCGGMGHSGGGCAHAGGCQCGHGGH